MQRFEHLSTEHTLRLWGKLNHGSVLINGPSICKTLLALERFSMLSVGVFGICWQLGELGGCYLKIMVLFWCPCARMATEHYIWATVSPVSQWKQTTCDWLWLCMCENMSWDVGMCNESLLAAQRVAEGQRVSNPSRSVMGEACELVQRKKVSSAQYKNNTSWNGVLYIFTMC